MARTAIYPDTFRNQVREYLNGYDSDAERALAEVDMRVHFQNVIANPRLGASSPGIFENLPVYRFSSVRGRMRFATSIMYEYDRDRDRIEFLGFAAAPVAPA